MLGHAALDDASPEGSTLDDGSVENPASRPLGAGPPTDTTSRPFPGTEARAYTLADLVDQALRDSHWIAAQHARVEERVQAGEQSAAWENPVLGLSAGRKKVPSDRGSVFDVSITQPFLYPGKRALATELASIESDIARVRFEEARASVAADVVRLAYRYAIARRKQVFLASRRERFELMNTYLEGRVFASPQAAAERQIIETRLERLEAEALAVEGTLGASQAALALYVDWSASGNTAGGPPDLVVPWLPAADALDVQAWLERASERNFDLAAQRERVRAAETEAELAARQSSPDFALSAFYSEEKAGDDERVAGLGISFPLSLTDRNQAGARSAQHRLGAEISTLRYVEQLTRSRLEQLHSGYAVATERARRYPEATLERWATPLTTADEEFRKGRVDLLTLLELDAEIAEATTLALDAQAELADRLVELLLWAGEPDPLPWFGVADDNADDGAEDRR